MIFLIISFVISFRVANSIKIFNKELLRRSSKILSASSLWWVQNIKWTIRSHRTFSSKMLYYLIATCGVVIKVPLLPRCSVMANAHYCPSCLAGMNIIVAVSNAVSTLSISIERYVFGTSCYARQFFSQAFAWSKARSDLCTHYLFPGACFGLLEQAKYPSS